VSLTHRTRHGALVLTAAALFVACAADPGEDAKPAFSSQVSGDDDAAATDDVSPPPIDSGEVPDGESSCPPATPTLCGATCVDTTSDADNCGGCGVICSGGATCSGSRCTGTNADAAVDARADSSADAQASADISVDAPAPADSGVDAKVPVDASASDAQPCPECAGCCDTGGNCSKGTSATACGADGVFCVDCTATNLTCHTGGICR
jgi:hypothetical protein